MASFDQLSCSPVPSAVDASHPRMSTCLTRQIYTELGLPNYCYHESSQPCPHPASRGASPRENSKIPAQTVTRDRRLLAVTNPDTYTAQPTRKPVRHRARDPLRLFRGYLHWFATFYALFSSSPAVPKILSCSCRRRSKSPSVCPVRALLQDARALLCSCRRDAS